MVKELLMLGSSSNFKGNVNINADELYIRANKIKFYTQSLTNCAVFSSPSVIKYNYGLNTSWEINIPYQLNMSIVKVKEIQMFGDEEREVDCPYSLKITNNILNLAQSNKQINIPYGMNMGLSSTEFSVYDDDETKNITFPKGLRMVIDGNNLRVWKPGTVINSNLNDYIQINYGFRALAGTSFLVFHKPGDTIDSGNASPNQIKMPFDLSFKSDDTHLTILKPGDSTKGVKLAWQTL
jgi:hypothetical protein